MKAVRPTVSTPHPALSSVEEERESTLRALLRAARILQFASFVLFADRDWRLGSRRDLHAGSVRYEARAPRFLDSRHSHDSRIKSAWNESERGLASAVATAKKAAWLIHRTNFGRRCRHRAVSL